MDKKITPLTLMHVDEIFQIESESFSSPWTKDSIIASLDNPLVNTFGYFDSDNKLCGFVCASVIPPEAEILNIAVLGTYRRQGIGEALLSSIFDYFEKNLVDTVFLEVRASNLPAQSLYRKFGFETMGKRLRYYSDPTEDAILMRKNMDQTFDK